MKDMRICFFGDSITAGTGDETGQGWVGRLAVRDSARGKLFTAYNLGIRRDTSRRIAMRWRHEWAHRILANRPSAIVAMFGINDCAGAETNYDGVDHGQRVEAAVSLGIARNMITAMKSVAPVLWLGPTPLVEEMMDDDPPGRPPLPPRLERLAVIDRSYADCAAALGIPYLGCLDALLANDAFMDTLRNGDGVHPSGDGHQMIADLVTGWPAWRALIES
jgi:lysophospholipase L1-like esterase